MASIEHYRLEMEAHLPERDDNLLFKYHKQAAEKAIKHAAKVMKKTIRHKGLDDKQQTVLQLPSIKVDQYTQSYRMLQ